jgi:hypothetical protein
MATQFAKRTRCAVLTLCFVALMTACSSGTRSSQPPPTQLTISASPSAALLPSATSKLCGAWSAETSPQARAIRPRHESLDSCHLVGQTWFVTAISPHRPGQVGYLVCQASDSICLNGSAPHDLTRFTWVSAPAIVGPGLKPYSAPSPHEWIFHTRFHGMLRFNTSSKTLSTCPSGVCR